MSEQWPPPAPPGRAPEPDRWVPTVSQAPVPSPFFVFLSCSARARTMLRVRRSARFSGECGLQLPATVTADLAPPRGPPALPPAGVEVEREFWRRRPQPHRVQVALDLVLDPGVDD